MNLVEKLYEKYSETDRDFLLSPYSIHVALAMAKEGAVGETLAEMEELLGADPEIIVSETVKTANAIWLLCEVDSAWRVTVWRKYQGEATDIRGVSNPEAMIDQWASEKTNGKIKRIMGSPIKKDERLIITNAIHFKDDWLHQFKKELTKKTDFFLSESDVVRVDMMEKTESVSYWETSKYQAIRLRYKNDDVTMTIILPRDWTVPISFTDIEDVRGGRRRQKVRIFIPKFKMERSYSLKNALAEMGMPLAFTDFADFKGISLEGVKIDDVVHKTFIDVDEEGTEAAAVTAVRLRTLSATLPPPIPVFRADHPFVFYLEDERTRTILFIGSVKSPTA